MQEYRESAVYFVKNEVCKYSAIENNQRSLGGGGGGECVEIGAQLFMFESGVSFGGMQTIHNLTVSFYVNQPRLINRKYS